MNNEITELPKKNNDEKNIIKESKEMIKKDVKGFKTFIKDVKEYLTTRNTNELKDLVVRLILITIVIIILYVPYQFLMEIIEDIIRAASINYSEFALNKYYSIGRIIYLVLAIVLFYHICKDRFYKLVKNQEIINNNQK